MDTQVSRCVSKTSEKGTHVLAVDELDDVAERVAHGAVVGDHDVLERLDEPALDVSRLGGLDGRVDESLSPGHGVEKELLRGEAAEVRVLDEAARLGRVVVLGEVRQRAELEPERHALALDDLLPDTGRHLGDVDEGALGAGNDHLLDVVVLLERLLGGPSGRVTRRVERLVDLGLERLADRHARLGLELVELGGEDDLRDGALGRLDEVSDRLHRALVGDRVADTDREAVVEQPKVDDLLHAAEEVARDLGPLLAEDDVDDAALRRADGLLVDDAVHELAVLDPHAAVEERV